MSSSSLDNNATTTKDIFDTKLNVPIDNETTPLLLTDGNSNNDKFKSKFGPIYELLKYIVAETDVAFPFIDMYSSAGLPNANSTNYLAIPFLMLTQIGVPFMLIIFTSMDNRWEETTPLYLNHTTPMEKVNQACRKFGEDFQVTPYASFSYDVYCPDAPMYNCTNYYCHVTLLLLLLLLCLLLLLLLLYTNISSG